MYYKEVCDVCENTFYPARSTSYNTNELAEMVVMGRQYPSTCGDDDYDNDGDDDYVVVVVVDDDD